MTRAGIGVFGGTFNPIHLGHLRAAEEVAEALDLERIVFVPSASPPHKETTRGDPLAPAALRLGWVRGAIMGNPRFSVDPVEVERDGPSWSVETLRSLGAKLRPERPVFVIGCDAFAEIHTWREPESLFSLAHFAVMTRPPVSTGSLADWLPKSVRDDVEISPDGSQAQHRSGTWIRLVEVSALDISASGIRRRLRDGQSVRYLVPESVREAVIASGAYSAG